MKALYILKSIDGAPGEFQVLPYGKIDIEGEEPAFLDEKSMESIISTFEGRENDMVIDYEHQTLTGVEAPAAGWIKKFINKGKEGLWVVVEWTEKAKQYIANREYRYFSPVFWTRKSDRKVVQIDNVALTNDPKINGLQPIIAKMTRDLADKNMAKTINKGEKNMLKKLRKIFGLADDAGEEKVVEAVEAVVAKNKELEVAATKKTVEVVACKEVLDVLKLEADADKEVVVAAIAGLGKTDDVAQKLSLEVAKLSKQISEMKQDDLVQLALKEGKTSPEELESWGRDLAKANPDQFEKIVLSRPKGSVIPIDKVDVIEDKKQTGAADEVQLSINKMMGIDDETWKKHNPDAKEA